MNVQNLFNLINSINQTPNVSNSLEVIQAAVYKNGYYTQAIFLLILGDQTLSIGYKSQNASGLPEYTLREEADRRMPFQKGKIEPETIWVEVSTRLDRLEIAPPVDGHLADMDLDQIQEYISGQIPRPDLPYSLSMEAAEQISDHPDFFYFPREFREEVLQALLWPNN